MIHLPASVRVYVCLTPCDMRKSFDSHALVREHLELDAFAGHLFVFASRRKDRVKILYWDRDGFAKPANKNPRYIAFEPPATPLSLAPVV
jgi:transposase